MRSDQEHSPLGSKPSNEPGGRADRALTRACKVLHAPDGARRTHLLECVLDGLAVERAFLLRQEPRSEASPTARVVDSALRRDDGERHPSRSLSMRALRLEAAELWFEPEVTADDARSVRRMALRTALAAPLPGQGPTTVLLADSRHRPEEAPAALLDRLLALVALLGALPLPLPALSTPDPASIPAEAGQPAFDAVRRQARRAAATRLPVLLRGESGTGKERLADEIHRSSARRHGPYVALNCAALSESLLEAELFGSDRGAFTGADRSRRGLLRAADGGTLFLDEIGDMPGAMQAKLLRVLQEGRVRPVGSDREQAVNLRIVAATHRDLAERVERGLFRADLYYRLAVLEICIPPLRDRGGDLPGLVRALTPELLEQTGRPRLCLSPAARSLLERHDWPGNVRELRSLLARSLVRSEDGAIDVEHLAELAPVELAERTDAANLERAMILEALREERGVVAAAATRIGWTRQKLYRRMRVLGVRRPAGPAPASRSSERVWGNASSDSSTFQ